MATLTLNRVVPADALDTEVRRFTDAIVARSASTIRIGKAAFYEQIERPPAAAYELTSGNDGVQHGLRRCR